VFVERNMKPYISISTWCGACVLLFQCILDLMQRGFVLLRVRILLSLLGLCYYAISWYVYSSANESLTFVLCCNLCCILAMIVNHSGAAGNVEVVVEACPLLCSLNSIVLHVQFSSSLGY